MQRFSEQCSYYHQSGYRNGSDSGAEGWLYRKAAPAAEVAAEPAVEVAAEAVAEPAAE